MTLWLTNFKALLIVLAAALTVFALARPFCLRFMGQDEFVRRRNIWLALTTTAFLVPSFWLYALIAIPVLAWGAHKDSNPVAFGLLMLHVIPPNVGFQLPTIIINQLFELNQYRILSIAVLLPAAVRLWRANDKATGSSPKSMDVMILAFFTLNLLLLMPYETVTNTLRRGFVYFLDALVVYYVVSRTCTNPRSLAESMAAFCLSAAILAPVAAFEFFKGWLLYTGVGTFWGDQAFFTYLYRDGSLRAQAAVAHAIQLGYVMAISLGCCLYLGTRATSMASTKIIAALLCIGLLATQSRGPWTIAVAIFVVYSAMGPNSVRRLFKAMFVLALIVGAILVSPMGDFVIQRLPFIGSVDTGTIVYRQRLAEVAWGIVQENPFFGVPYVTVHLESLRQGQGIIDLVNVYATIAMSYGLVGLLFWFGPFLIGMWHTYRTARSTARHDGSISLMGACLLGCMVGTSLIMATSAYQFAIYKMFFVLTGFAAGYVRFGNVMVKEKIARSSARPDARPAPLGVARGTAGPLPR